MRSNRGIDRRDFVKGGIAVGSLAALASLAGCGGSENNDPWLPEKWDHEADVIVVGCGGAGLAALIESADQGMSAIGLEHMQNVGGNSAICNGGMDLPGSPIQEELGIDDSADLFYEDLTNNLGADVNEEMMRLYADLAVDLYGWLTDNVGIEFESGEVQATNGTSRKREHFVDPSQTIMTMQDQAKSRGSEIHLQTKAVRIIQDPVSKRVLGIEAQKDGESLYYKARRGIIMASGGYARNDAMMDQHLVGIGAENIMHMGHLGDDGSGMLACMELGVDTRHISYVGLLCTAHPEGGGTKGSAMYHMGGILVNKEGRRFVDESNGYTNVWPDVQQQTDQTCFCIYDQEIADRQSGNNSAYYDHLKNVDSGLLITADTVEELAAAIGCPADTLNMTLNTYNGDVETSGVDSEFGRDHLITESGDPVTIDHPPYYAWQTMIAIACTQGGLKKDISCQAIDVKGNIIPGLFLAGNISHYSEMGITPGTRQGHDASGTGFGGAIAFGRYEAQQIASLMEPWDEV